MTLPIIQSAADYYGITADEITGPRRFAELIPARAAVAYILRNREGMSFPKIGGAIGGRDHTTARHLVLGVAADLMDGPDGPTFRLFVESQMAEQVEELAPIAKPEPLPEALGEPVELEEVLDGLGKVFTIDQHGRTREDRFERHNTIRGTRLLAQALRKALAA